MNPKESYSKIFESYSADGARDRIISAVFVRIATARRRQAIFSTVTFGVLAIAASVSFIPAIDYLLGAASHSGFTQYISLLSTDGLVVLQYWKELAMSIIESAPIAESALLTAIVLIFVYSVRSLVASFDGLSNHSPKTVS
ncbi:hypothetical protein KGQ27_02170 [Patescibacteria group bacterium]|nr:hypothetical protein [Patescibacteria group bacterium]MDE1946276.1 hypothetical protein [Patescibacteria group bacterium]MDE2010728.1 hypothetical protein [Patescibacteria group bacterium]MDE2232612.1 hypothetical protein [Patescibacteria group bacterium]